MQDSDVVFDAVGKLLAEHLEAFETRINLIENALQTRFNLTIDHLIHDERTKKAFAGKDGSAGKDADPEAVYQLLKSDQEFIERCKGEAGKHGSSVALNDVVNTLLDDAGFIDRVKGKDGRDSDSFHVAERLKADEEFRDSCTPIISHELIAEQAASRLMSDPDFVKRCAGADGKDGKDCDPKKVIASLKSDADFIAKCTPSLPNDITADSIAERIKSDGFFYAECRGVDGADADPEQVAKALAVNAEFVASCKGTPGKDGAEADPATVAETLAANPEFIGACKGDKGDDADPETVAEILLQDANFIKSVKGEPGEKGQKGEPGLDRPIITPYVIEQTDEKVNLEKNAIAQFNGSLYQATRKTIGSPKTDPSSYQLLVAGIESVKQAADLTTRDYVFTVTLANGQTNEFRQKMLPGNITGFPETAKVIKGDYAIVGSDLYIAKKDYAEISNEGDFDVVSLRGEAGAAGKEGEPGKRGRKGMTGNGIDSVVYGDGHLMITHTDDREPLCVDLKRAILETLAELKIIGELSDDHST